MQIFGKRIILPAGTGQDGGPDPASAALWNQCSTLFLDGTLQMTGPHLTMVPSLSKTGWKLDTPHVFISLLSSCPMVMELSDYYRQVWKRKGNCVNF